MEHIPYIAGIGSFSPGAPVPFAEIENYLGFIENATPKIMKRMQRLRKVMQEMLGIEYSHYALDPITREGTESNVSMAVKSAQIALDKANLKAKDVDLIIYAGILYDVLCPPSSTLVQEKLDIPYCAEISIHSNCTAIYKAIQVGADFIRLGRYKNILIVTSQLSSTFLRSEYFNQSKLTEEQLILRWFLSDGSGALILTSEPRNSTRMYVEDTYLESVGTKFPPAMYMNIGASNWDIQKIYENGDHHLTQNITDVTNIAPKQFETGINKMLEKTKLDVSSVKCFFANIPTKHLMDLTIESLRKDWKRDNLPFYTKLSTRGYQGAPSIIVALDDYLQEHTLKPNERLVSFVAESSKWMHAGFIFNTLPF